MFKLTVIIAIFQLSLVLRAGAAVVTLYEIDPIRPSPTENGLKIYGTTKYSAINPGQTDVTKYGVEEVRTQVLLHQSPATFTVLSVPTTMTYTIEQGASVYRASVPATLNTQLPNGFAIRFGGHAQDCTFDTQKKEGVCQYVQQKLLPFTLSDGQGLLTTVTSTRADTYTYSGTLRPIATITTSGASHLNTPRYVATIWSALGVLSIALFCCM